VGKKLIKPQSGFDSSHVAESSSILMRNAAIATLFGGPAFALSLPKIILKRPFAIQEALLL